MKPLIQAVHIAKNFPGVRALSDISIDFCPGEVHALLGENGAGKSTLIKILSGVYTPTEGHVLLDGEMVCFTSPRQALDAGIAVIHQELSIANDLTVAENIFLGMEPRRNNSMFVDKKKMNVEAQRVLDFMQVSIRATDVARDLTAAQQQMAEIAKVVVRNAKVVVMDEPTSSLSEHEINALFTQIRMLREKNVAIIYISHRLKEVFQICDCATVLRDGCFVTNRRISETTEKELVANMVGREMKDYYNRQTHVRGEETLRVENLCGGKWFQSISFSAYKGEILGVAGLIGAGRTEVMETIFGARKRQSGKVFVNGKEVNFQSPREAIAARIGMVTEDRRRTGLMVQATVQENIVLPSLSYHHKKLNFLDLKWEKDVAAEYVRKLGVKTPSVDTLIANLSGGNQQKVILAKWLVVSSDILILDEPTRGIDVNAKSEFYALMNEFAASGGTVIMVSSELPEIIGISDRILVMREGRLTGEMPWQKATEENIITLASLHDGSKAADIQEEMR
ncbi:MAG: sugar ABC transporter ATP-binding protein [Christensenellaceae bacterium]|nr:sugar ABC transporter ATP-binding protein [Christensenellaceae bacterium]MEA5065942.1 sugar ABC transporter ATP-binding protein [Eubacteriales bacterium]MEA5069785.1 sugar ABC transporter ATP-binding protein [Christensenellaceae bacterium]